jgi:hypothetical protein
VFPVLSRQSFTDPFCTTPPCKGVPLLTDTLCYPEMATENVQFILPDAPPKVDLMFSFDLTGSMGEILSTAKARANDIMNDLKSSLPGVDFQFGVISYMDYPVTAPPAAANCGYSFPYGFGFAACGDYPYRLDQGLTGTTDDVASAIGGLSLGCGANGAEAYTRVMYEAYADTNILWRSGARRILLNFGDNLPHDCNLNEGVEGGTFSTGKDPGRDGAFNTGDDLDLHTVLQGLVDNGIMMIEAHTSQSRRTLWEYWTGLTGGTFLLTSSTTMVDDVIATVTSSVTTQPITGLHIAAVDEVYESWVTSILLTEGDILPGDEIAIDVTFSPPDGAAEVLHDIPIDIFDDDGVGYGLDQNALITVQCNLPPDCEGAVASQDVIWPPNHKMIAAGVDVADPNGDVVTITILGITQDESLDSTGDGNTEPDAIILENGLFQVRAERSGKGNGRVYRVAFEASDGTESCTGQVTICVPHNTGRPCVDAVAVVIDSTIPGTTAFTLRGNGPGGKR